MVFLFGINDTLPVWKLLHILCVTLCFLCMSFLGPLGTFVLKLSDTRKNIRHFEWIWGTFNSMTYLSMLVTARYLPWLFGRVNHRHKASLINGSPVIPSISKLPEFPYPRFLDIIYPYPYPFYPGWMTPFIQGSLRGSCQQRVPRRMGWHRAAERNFASERPSCAERPRNFHGISKISPSFLWVFVPFLGSCVFSFFWGRQKENNRKTIFGTNMFQQLNIEWRDWLLGSSSQSTNGYWFMLEYLACSASPRNGVVTHNLTL